MQNNSLNIKSKDSKGSNITLYTYVKNESSRIIDTLNSFKWVDEMVIVDKCSKDGTKELIKDFGIDALSQEEDEDDLPRLVKTYGTKKWCIAITASDLIHPGLVDEIIKLTTSSTFDFEVIGLPYRHYNFGIHLPSNPWDRNIKYCLFTRDNYLGSRTIHHEISFKRNSIYKLRSSNSDFALYHLTNKTSKIFNAKICRYMHHESVQENLPSNKSAIFDIFKALYVITFKKRTIFKGEDAIALASSYLAYWLLRYITIWDANRVSSDEYANKTYPRIVDWLAANEGKISDR